MPPEPLGYYRSDPKNGPIRSHYIETPEGLTPKSSVNQDHRAFDPATVLWCKAAGYQGQRYHASIEGFALCHASLKLDLARMKLDPNGRCKPCKTKMAMAALAMADSCPTAHTQPPALSTSKEADPTAE